MARATKNQPLTRGFGMKNGLKKNHVWCPFRASKPQVNLAVCFNICKREECSHNSNYKENITMKKEEEKKEASKTVTIGLADLMLILTRLESKVDVINDNLEELKTGTFTVTEEKESKKGSKAEGNGKRKLSKEEKEALKVRLLAGIPYTKQELTEMKFQELKILGSSMEGVKTFGLGRPDCVANILKAQKKLAKKVEKKTEGKVEKKAADKARK